MLRTDQVADDLRGQRSLQAGRQVRALIHRAKRILLTIFADELEGLRLHAAAFLLRLESAREPVKIEHRHSNRRRPEDAIVVAEQERVEAAGRILGAGRDRHAIGSGDRRRWRDGSLRRD